MLEAAGASIGDEVEVKVGDRVYRGILMARYELADPDYIVVKLPNGYNVGVKVSDGMAVKKIAAAKRPQFNPPPRPPIKPGLPRVFVMSTGGTIASRIDYRTGGVRAALTAEDLLSIVPELSDIADLDAEILFSLFSENLTPAHWDRMAREVDALIRKGVDGIVISHGTDTMAYSAAALSFALQKPPIPVVFVGAQRSSDRPSSDAAMNLIAAVKVAGHAPFAEVCLTMHAWHSDTVIAVHRGTRARKLHTSSRDAFRSVNAEPIAYIVDGEIRVNASGLNPRGAEEYSFKPGFSGDAALVKFYPGMPPILLESLVEKGCRGIILEGTGLGHVSSDLIPSIKEIVDRGVFVGMTSQCIYGRVNMRVYETGRDLLKAGVTPLDDMLPETAYAKLSWALAQTRDIEEVRELMLTPIAGELGGRSLPTREEVKIG
ncbi:MAG: Glu-tRNA(Gln) amidotransferase subunit GatD [Thaumarchaeota archaeon]|nr:Glu-tRNA(Gln) amidotransferase subunit GatD [Nitrososphaerota archaeon]